MEKTGSGKSMIRFFLAEFVMVFLGVLVAFAVNDWGERRKEKEFTGKIIKNITEDIRADSVSIVFAINMIEHQTKVIDSLTSFFKSGQYHLANDMVKSCYTSINAFEPSTESYQSMIYSGDLKLIEDFEMIRMLKEIDQTNRQVDRVHDLYFDAICDIRNSFICKEDMDELDLKKFANQREFGNRLQFLRGTYLKNYAVLLRKAQSKYHKFLQSV